MALSRGATVLFLEVWGQNVESEEVEKDKTSKAQNLQSSQLATAIRNRFPEFRDKTSNVKTSQGTKR